jgi:nucleoside-diphosphate-sugar epimerase
MHDVDADRSDVIRSEPDLEERLAKPNVALVEFIKTLPSPLVILGAGGKMGPTLSLLASRAAHAANHPLEIIAVSRFREEGQLRWFERHGITAVSNDLLDSAQVRKLPDAPNVIYLVGLKFGTSQNPARTWAVNTLIPDRVIERYRTARIVALSTGNVYPNNDIKLGGSQETDPLTPLGEYANAAVGRERIFQFCSELQGTPITLLRLFYAVELRYGVLVDIARKVYRNAAIELANGHFNCIWQGDANDLALRALALAASPPSIWNLCRPEIYSTRAVAARLGELMGRTPRFNGTEAPTALLGNPARLCAKLGAPSVTLEAMLGWIAHWAKQGGRDLDKPTHFEGRDGKY